MQTSIVYNENHVEYDGKLEDTQNGSKLWLDIVNPTTFEISEITKTFELDKSALEALEYKSKKPQVRVLDNHKFTIILDIKYRTFEDWLLRASICFTEQIGS
jgi:magnesium transporter